MGQSITKGTLLEFFIISGGVEALLVEGAADTIYDFINFRVEQTMAPTPLSTLWWRSVGNSHSAFVMETMLDELAEASQTDPFELRMKMLQKSPRHLAVLQLLREQSKWGKEAPPPGRAWGMAIHESFSSVVGHVAEVSIVDGVPKVHRVWSAVHCGQVVNPAGAAAQIEGAIAFGLSAALYQKVELKDGDIVQTNFNSYPVLRLPEMPQVMVSFVETEDSPTGLGEPGLPAIAPAVANAVYKLTQKRHRVLPFGVGATT